MINDIGIVDTKKVISAINEVYQIDFSNFALTAFKQRLLYVLNENNYTSVIDFISNVENNQSLFEQYLAQGAIDTTEMFRDPSCWRDLRDKHLRGLAKNSEIRILVSDLSSGDDLYTLLIVLKEEGLLDNTKIVGTSVSNLILDRIHKGGRYDLKKIEIGEANYKRFSGCGVLSDYYSLEGNKVKMDTNLLKNVELKKYSYLSNQPLTNFHLVLYRNRIIYFNPTLQEAVVGKLVKSLLVGGVLCLGSKENIENSLSFSKLSVLNADEKIFKKRID